MTSSPRQDIPWCQKECGYARHLHVAQGALELAEVPVGFYWARLRGGKKILDSYYQGRDVDRAEDALRLVWRIFAPSNQRPEKKQRPLLPEEGLDQEAWRKVSTLIAKWVSKVDLKKGPTNVEIALVVQGISRILTTPPLDRQPRASKKCNSSPAEGHPGKSSEPSKAGSSFSVQKVRETHPRAYERWTEDEESQMTTLFHSGVALEEIARSLDRQVGGVQSRLKKLGFLEDE